MKATALAPGEVERPATGFLSWWLGELRELVPPRWRRHGAPQRCILLAPDADGFTVYRRRSRTMTPIGRLTSEGADRAQVRRLQRTRQPLWLMLPAADGLVARDSLPSNAERDLRKIMRHRIEVLTPWPASLVYADARVSARRADGMLAVELAVVGRDALDPLIARLAAMGVAIDGVDLADARALPAGFDLLPMLGGSRRRRGRWLLPSVLGGAVVLTLGGWAGVNIIEIEGLLGQKRRHLAALEQRFADLPELRDRLESKRERASFVAERRREAVSPTVVLEVMSRTLPDDVWLTELQLDGREVIASGYARDAATVVPLIERSRHFAQVRSRSPSTRVELTAADGSSRRVERFSVTAVVTPLTDPLQ